MSNYFISGATGDMGSHVVLHLLEHSPHILYCLVRGKSEEQAREKLLNSLRQVAELSGKEWKNVLPLAEGRVFVVLGDITRPNLGIDPARGEKLPRYDEVIHMAATLEYSEANSAEILTSNVSGTREMLNFAVQNGAGVFNYTGTAYVSGAKSGIILEEEYDRNFPPHNAYEQSKRLAEDFVLSFCKEHNLHYRILRPSIIIGDSKTFKSASMSGLYGFLRTLIEFYYGERASMPGYLSCHPLKFVSIPGMGLNFIPADFVANDVVAIINDKRTIDRMVHITSTKTVALEKILHAINVLHPLDQLQLEIVYDREMLNEIDELRLRPFDFFNPHILYDTTWDKSNSAFVAGMTSDAEFARIEGNIDRYLSEYFQRDSVQRLLSLYEKKGKRAA